MMRPAGLVQINRGSIQAQGLAAWMPLVGTGAATGVSPIYAHRLTGDIVMGTVPAGAPQAAVTSVLDPEFGPVLHANGANQGNFHFPSAFGVGSGGFLSIWAKFTGNTAGELIKVGGVADGWGLGVGSGTMDVVGGTILGLYDNVAWVNSGVAFPVNVWSLYGLAVAGTSAKFYLNGQLIASNTVGGGSPVPGTAQFIVGGDNTDRNADVTFTEGRAYSRIPSEAVIAAMYAPDTRWELYQRKGGTRRYLALGSGGVVNLPPVVYAGPDQAITMPVAFATMAGVVTDDGLI